MYIKNRSKLGIASKDIFQELCNVYGQNEVSYSTVTRWVKKFKMGLEGVKDATKPGRSHNAATNNVIQKKVLEVVDSDARLTVREIAQKVGVSPATTIRILKRELKMTRISARWIPHLLSEDQTRMRVKLAKDLLKLYPTYDWKQFSNIITGDETWVHFF